MERCGRVKRSSTALPVRLAERSETGCGRLSEGALGGPGLAHPRAKSVEAAARMEARLRLLGQNRFMLLSVASGESQSDVRETQS